MAVGAVLAMFGILMFVLGGFTQGLFNYRCFLGGIKVDAKSMIILRDFPL